MSVAARVRLTGPLTSYREGFAAAMMARGYTDLSLANQLRLAADFSRWLERKTIGVGEINDKIIAGFLSERRRKHTRFVSTRALAPLLDHLVQVGALVRATPAPRPQREELCAYEQYLVEERGVAPARVALCLKVAEEFLGAKRVDTTTAADVTRFVSRGPEADRLSALRSVLRFLFASSRCATNLVYAVPSSPGWTQRALPQGLEPREVAAVLGSCDRRTHIGARDYAVLLLMIRLGLRAGEVAVLRLDDIDWQSGEVLIRGKGKSLGRLPLPEDVGEAITRYLRRAHRPTGARAVFVHVRAPYGSMTSGGIIGIAQRALRAAGIHQGGAHRLRHTAATQLLRRGATMTDIAQVLRHRHVNTTAIYAKVDHAALRSVAREWPVAPPTRLVELARVWPGGAA